MKPRATLYLGVVAWVCALALMPAEIAAGRTRTKASARTVGTVALALVAAVLVLHGLPRRRAD